MLKNHIFIPKSKYSATIKYSRVIYFEIKTPTLLNDSKVVSIEEEHGFRRQKVEENELEGLKNSG